MDKIHFLLIAFIRVIKKQLNEKQFLIFSSVLIGLSCGLAAIVLKFFAHRINIFVDSYAQDYQHFFLFILFPVVGLLLTVLYLRRFIKKEEFQKGSADIVYSIAKKSSTLPYSQIYSHIISSAFTVGFGGSVGLESPLVSAGSAIGSNYGRVYRLSYKDKTLLLGCGAAAVISAAFNAPIAGVLFAVEVLLAEASASAFIPLIISAASGALLSKIILSEKILLSFESATPFNYSNTLFYIALGVLTGFVSLYYTRVYTRVEHAISQIGNIYTRILFGGCILALLLIIFPPLYGEGYAGIKLLALSDIQELTRNSVIQSLIFNEWTALLFVAALIFVKTLAAAITVGSGGNGGNFAPSLCVGAYLGYSVSQLVNIMGWAKLPLNNFTLVAMAGILSGVFYAPLTAIFLIAEITRGYDLIIPLMIVASISNAIMKYFEHTSMENKKLATRMNLSVENRDKYLLSKLNLEEMIETNFEKIPYEATLKDLVKSISVSKRNFFPVIHENGNFAGVVLLDSVKEMMFEDELYNKINVKDVMTIPKAIITPKESLHSAIKKFEETEQWNIPVIDEERRYIGFLSKSSILSEYREEIRRSS